MKVVSRFRPGIPASLAGSGIETVRHHVNLIAEEPKAEIGQQVRTHHVIEPGGDAVVERGGLAGERADAAAGIVSGAAGDAVDAGRIDSEVGEAVSAEPVKLFGLVVIDAGVQGIVIELHRAGARVVRLILGSGHVRRRNQFQQVGRGLRRIRLGRNHRSRETASELPALRRSMGRRCPSPSPLRSPVAFGERRHAQQNAAACVAARALVIAKIEQLVLLDRAADRCAELIPLRDGNHAAIGPEDGQAIA